MLGLPKIGGGVGVLLVSSAVAGATGCFGRTSPEDFAGNPDFAFDAGSGGSTSAGGSAGAAGSKGGRGTIGGSSGRAGGRGRGGAAGFGGFAGQAGNGNGGIFETGGSFGDGGQPGTGGRGAGGVVGSGGRGTGGAPRCDASCSGCCDGAGNCVSGTDTNACGLGGVACLDCGSIGFACDNGICQGAPPVCGPSNCAGCCDALGRCRSGSQTDACGLGGGACSNCGARNQECQGGKCAGVPPPTCDASNCGGCCDSSGTCGVGTSNASCGTNGGACENCSASGRTCNQPGSYCAYIPSCSALTCPSGCCSDTGACMNGRTDAACGSSGQACSNCTAAGQQCSSGGFCYNGIHCGPDNCNGCCNPNGRCLAGTGSRNCGLYGAECDNCVTRGETCQGGACGVVGATCPAPYPGCTPGLMTTPPVQSRSCTGVDLAAIEKACPGMASSSSCTSTVVALSSSNPGCFDCIQQFLYDGAAVKCLAPFLTPACNQALSCATECTNASCSQCGAAAKQSCQDEAFQSGNACAPYVNGYFCARAAFSGPAAFCDIVTIGSVGAFLQGVGAYYCSP